MRTLEQLLAVKGHSNVRGWQAVVRAGESSQRPIAYRMLYGYDQVKAPDRLLKSYADHPRVFFKLKDGRRTSAAGAYQITATSWDDMSKRRPGVYRTFEPAMQDLWMIDRTDFRMALDAVLAGDLETAIHLCRMEWTSLPGASEQNGGMERARRVFEEFGGRLAA